MNVHLINQTCLEIFPELLEEPNAEEVLCASAEGLYMLHEDYLVPFILSRRKNKEMMVRFADYLEGLLSSEESERSNLAEVALTENIVDAVLIEACEHLGPLGLNNLNSVTQRMIGLTAEDWINVANEADF